MNPMFIGPIFELINKGIDRWIPDPEQKAKAQLDVLRMQQDGEFKELETRMGAIMEEAKSQHNFVALARPSFMYVFYFIIIAMVIIAPVIGMFRPEAMELFFLYVGKGFQAIPEPLWWTFTSGYLGYGAYRTYEKKNGVAK